MILEPRHLQAFNAVLQEESMRIPRYQNTRVFRVCKTSASPNLWLTGHSILLDVTFKVITLISGDIQKNGISSFETYSLFMCFASIEGVLCSHFFAKMILTPRQLGTVPRQGY